MDEAQKKPRAPCRDCEKREPVCHSFCEQWAEYVVLRDRFYEEQHKARDVDSVFITAFADRLEKRRRDNKR